MLSANDTNSDGNKLYSKIDVFFCSNLPIDDDIINLMFEAPRGRPKDDDDMTYPTRGVIDPKNADVICEQPLTTLTHPGVLSQHRLKTLIRDTFTHVLTPPHSALEVRMRPIALRPWRQRFVTLTACLPVVSRVCGRSKFRVIPVPI